MSIRRRIKAQWWKRRGSVPHGPGANAARWLAIGGALSAAADRYGWDDPGLDERVVEYAWLFDRMRALAGESERVLDAGSVLNYRPVLDGWEREEFPPVSIVTLSYEGHAFPSNRVRYEFADLRMLPYRDAWFSTVACLSTLEHVGLDTTIYGANTATSENPNREAAQALSELARVTRTGGTLLLSVPFGKRSHRGWFRVLDSADLESVISVPEWGDASIRCFRALREGWRECKAADAADAGYNEPPNRPGERTAPPYVAAAEAVALVEMRRR